MTHPITRRAFVHRAALTALATPFARWSASAGLPPSPLRIGMLPSSGTDDAAATRQLGVQLGVDEAKHAAGLFGGSIELLQVTQSSLGDRQLSAVLGSGSIEDCLASARAAERAEIGFMNLSCPSDSLRGRDCQATMFHVAPSDEMYRDALAQANAPADAKVAAWNPSLTRFGADTLNERFRSRFGRAMTADAWLGWVAIKILWESSLRARSTDSRMLMQYMVRDGTRFDGHKGRPLSFRVWDHQLRQPLYVVSSGTDGSTRVIAEMPATGSDEESSREVLDRLGTTAARSACRMSP
jgi:ABC-type branched-subunit amino acid transport system substrate-binding protein